MYLSGAVIESRPKSWRPFLVVALENTDQNYQINHSNLQTPLYNCLLVLLLHTAAVTKDLGSKAQVWGDPRPIVKPRLVSGHLFLSYIWRFQTGRIGNGSDGRYAFHITGPVNHWTCIITIITNNHIFEILNIICIRPICLYNFYRSLMTLKSSVYRSAMHCLHLTSLVVFFL